MAEETICYDNGDYYEGTIIKGVPDGTGMMWYINGDLYEGNWYRGRKHGKGTMTYADGRVVKGNWVEDEPVAPGSYDDLRAIGAQDCTVNGVTFQVGTGYSNDEVTSAFALPSGTKPIRRSKQGGTIVLFAVPDTPYRDGYGWVGGEFPFTGEGDRGDQTMTRGNRELFDSMAGSYYRVHLFVRRKPGNYVYNGRVRVDRHRGEVAADKDGVNRKVIRFILKMAE